MQTKAFDPLTLTIELGHAVLTLAEVQQLRAGAMISLQEYLDDPVTIYAGSKLVGRGEMLLIEDQLGIRITELYRFRTAVNPTAENPTAENPTVD